MAGILVALFALSFSAGGQDAHPYLDRALTRIAEQPDLVYRAEAICTREIAGTLAKVHGRVVVRRSDVSRRIAIDATIERNGDERGVSFRFDGATWRAADHASRTWTEGTHTGILGAEAAFALALSLDAIGDATPLEELAPTMSFQASERIGDLAVHRYHARPDASGASDAWSFGASDGMPRRVVERRWAGGAEHEVRQWRLVTWNPSPKFAIDPFTLPPFAEYTRVEPRAPVILERSPRPVHSLADSLKPLQKRMRATSAAFVVAVVSPT